MIWLQRLALFSLFCLVIAQDHVDLGDIKVKDTKDAVETDNGSTKLDSNTITFYHAFIASLSVIIVSEIGDKTWFIAAIMAMRHSRMAVFIGAIAALGLMTVLSAYLGWITQLIPRKFTFYISTGLFAFFGLKMLHEGYHMSPNESQEGYEEAQAEVQKTDADLETKKFSDLESGGSSDSNSTWNVLSFVSTIFLKSFTLTFLAEWGDRSQLTTIILGAREDVTGVILGGVLGHAICTGIAVIFGRLLAQQISVRTVTLIGGVVFIGFALSALFLDIEPDA
ncbi:unnamed protein product [Bursaphelenchus xylophilus]|uniref:GDT1 family protein n=1 Tax=Bursaphelenchus xylophilus TaxID=6326 RepID=A0A1I7SU20_BURXY|nr:unnamed protein product [Bursaphelenchus xylophilus]CAG9107676.1 unnamed protein product [Bursaphelenchus xylophilus]